MLIAARNSILQYSKRLPYDAEVEYIESTGTQWIDTGFAFQDDFAWEICFSGIKSEETIFGGRTASIRTSILYQPYFGISNNTAIPIAGYNAQSTPFQLSDLRNGTHTVKMSVKTNTATVLVDGNVVYDNVSFSGEYISGVTQALFADNFGNGDIREYSTAKVYALKMWQNGVLVRYFIPVRKGGVGYMYDRVSKQLFGNQGSGNFIVGPDVVEIEYIEANNVGLDSNQQVRGVIDTGIIPNLDTDVWECDAQFVQFGNTAGCWGCAGNRFAFGRGSESWNDWYFGLGNTNNRTGAKYDNLRHIFRLDGPNRTLTVDSTIYNGSGTIESGYNLTVAIFNRNSQNGITYRADNARSRCYSAKYYRNGVLIQHLVPVRVGMEGAMKDKVTGKIYRNQGTGAFKIGADRKETPLMCNSYVKDGLVAMWDGTENAGWGTHDSNATTWKDLIGTNDLVCGDPFDSNSLVANKHSTYRSNTSLTTDGILQAEICLNWPSPITGALVASFRGNTRIFAYAIPSRCGICVASGETGYGTWPSGQHTFSVSYSGSQSTGLAIDSIPRARSSGTDGWQTTGGIQLVRNSYSSESQSLDGNIYSVRLYSRALTAEEIAWNCEIDKRRFNLT